MDAGRRGKPWPHSPGCTPARLDPADPQPRAIYLCIASADDQTLVSVDLDTGAGLAIAIGFCGRRRCTRTSRASAR